MSAVGLKANSEEVGLGFSKLLFLRPPDSGSLSGDSGGRVGAGLCSPSLSS